MVSTSQEAPAASPAVARAADTNALPVAIDLTGPHADGVRRWIEGVLGWQPVDSPTAALVPPAVRLVDVAADPSGGDRAVPAVLLITGDDGPARVAAAGAAHVPAAVVRWPEDRDDLARTVEAVVALPRDTRGVVTALRVGGAAGGVGTTTVTLALAGLAAWRGSRVLVVIRDRALVREVRDVPAAALASPDLWDRATALPGVAGARAVHVAPTEPGDREPTGLGRGLVVVDAGVASDADVLVGRADAAGLRAFAATAAAAIVVVGDGPATPSALARACGPRRRLSLPWSARVARAGLYGRVPAGLPGGWLRRLAPLAPRPGPGPSR